MTRRKNAEKLIKSTKQAVAYAKGNKTKGKSQTFIVTRQKAKTVKAWAVVEPPTGNLSGGINPYSISMLNKKDCIKTYIYNSGFTWLHLHRDGYRCIPVIITEDKRRGRMK